MPRTTLLTLIGPKAREIALSYELNQMRIVCLFQSIQTISFATNSLIVRYTYVYISLDYAYIVGALERPSKTDLNQSKFIVSFS